MSVAGVRLVRELIARHGIDGEFVAGHMLTAVKPRHDLQLRAYVEELQQRYAYHGIRYMPAEEVRSVVASTRYRGALYDPNAGHLHPLKYTLGLAAAAERLGVRIFEGTRAVDFAGRAPVRVRTAGRRRALPAAGAVRQCLPRSPPHRSCRRGSWPSAPASWPPSRSARRARRPSSPTTRPSPT